VIGRRLHVTVVSKSPEQAADHFGWLAHFVGVDCPRKSWNGGRSSRDLLPTLSEGLISNLNRPRTRPLGTAKDVDCIKHISQDDAVQNATLSKK
jgi:hypothetical protein